jgi:hypothetical protein
MLKTIYVKFILICNNVLENIRKDQHQISYMSILKY